jgi:hypothetical protein
VDENECWMPQGVRSKLVLAKLGFDMRDAYDDVLTEPLPKSIRKRVERLPGPHAMVDSKPREPAKAVQAAQPEPEAALPDGFIADDGGPIT